MKRRAQKKKMDAIIRAMCPLTAGLPRLVLTRERRTWTALNHRTRRAARRETRRGVPEMLRRYTYRPHWWRHHVQWSAEGDA